MSLHPHQRLTVFGVSPLGPTMLHSYPRSVLFFCVFCAMVPSAALAEDAPQKTVYAELVADKEEIKKEKSEIRDILIRRGQAFAVDQEAIDTLDAFLRKYYFARMTDVSRLNELPQDRLNIRKKCQDTAGKSEAMEALNRLTSSMMHAICNGVLVAEGDAGPQQVIVLQESIRDENDRLRVVRSKEDLTARDRVFSLAGAPVTQGTIITLAPADTDFHPAVKFNAMLVLRDLNDKQPKKGKPETAVPRRNTQRDLIAYLESADKLSEPLLIGALIGIQRHAETETDPSRKKRIAEVILSIIDLPPDVTRNDAALIWIRRQAIDILGQLGLPGDDRIYVKKLYEVIKNKEDPLAVRIAAAQAMQKMDLSGLKSKAVELFLESLTQLAADACESEIDDYLRQNRDFSVNRLRVRLATVRTAVTGNLQGDPGEDDSPPGGLMAVASDEAQVALGKLVSEIQKIETRVDTPAAATDPSQVEQILRDAIRGLNGLQPSEGSDKPTPPQTAEKQ